MPSNANVIVEPQSNGIYRATQKGTVVATGTTQLKTAKKAHHRRPNAHVVAARVRTTQDGMPDRFRHIFGPVHK